MAKVGIQLKPDHPALWWKANKWDNPKPRVGDDKRSMCLATFACAYGCEITLINSLDKQGVMQVRDDPDGSVWVEFTNDELDMEEAGAAMRMLGMMGVK